LPLGNFGRIQEKKGFSSLSKRMNKNKVEGRGWRGEELCRYGFQRRFVGEILYHITSQPNDSMKNLKRSISICPTH